MSEPAMLAELWRGDFLESVHLGHAAIVTEDGRVMEGWGDVDRVILPRSSCKMLQALPLAESGASLTGEQLALACASHQGAAPHVTRVTAWLDGLGLSDADLRCGAHPPHDTAEKHALIREGHEPRQVHNNCSGKHAGFLELTRRLGAGPDYVDPDHPVQRAAREAFEDTTGAPSPGFAIDGCSAPNFATTLTGLARAMARFATATEGSARGAAMVRLREAMCAHPLLVAGEGRACTDLMRAMEGVAVKTGAEGVFVAILPARGLGVALKAADGATRAAEAAIAQILIRLGALDADHPTARRLTRQPLVNWRGIHTGEVRAALPQANASRA